MKKIPSKKKQSIFKSLFGDTETDEIFDKLDNFNHNFFRDTVGSKASSSDNISMDALGAFDSADNLSSSEKKATDPSGVGEFLRGLSISRNKSSRYETYDTIYESLQLVKRIINVYISNIFQRDTVNNTIFTIRNIENTNKDKSEECKKFAKQVVDFFQLEHKLSKEIGFNLLKYGDAYLELVNISEIKDLEKNIPKVKSIDGTLHKTWKMGANGENTDVGFSSSLIIETQVLSKLENKFSEKELSDTIARENIAVDYLSNLITIVDENDVDSSADVPDFEMGLIQESQNNKRQSSDGVNHYYSKLKGLFLKFHSTKDIEAIISPYGTLLGFIHIDQVRVNTSGIIQNIAGATNANSVSNPNRSLHSYLHNMQSDTENTAITNPNVVNALVLKLIRNVLIKFGVNFTSGMSQDEYIAHIKATIGEDLYSKILHLVAEVAPNSKKVKPSEKLRVRLIPVNKMYWFQIPGSDFNPYGRSIVDPLVFPGKLYILNQLSNLVTKMTRAPLVRKWTTDVGSRLDADNVVNKLKRQFKNTRLTAGDIVGTKTIANLLTNYRDLVVVQKNGKTFLDVEIAEMGNSNIHVEDLEDNRKEIIALSAIPPGHLGFPEPMELKESIVQSSTVMANEISVIQNTININLERFIDDIAKIVKFSEAKVNAKSNNDFDIEPEAGIYNDKSDDDKGDDDYDLPSEYIKITLFPPIVLSLQLIESSTTSVMNLVNVLSAVKTLKIDPITLLQKYVPYIDWVALQKEGGIADTKSEIINGPPTDGM